MRHKTLPQIHSENERHTRNVRARLLRVSRVYLSKAADDNRNGDSAAFEGKMKAIEEYHRTVRTLDQLESNETLAAIYSGQTDRFPDDRMGDLHEQQRKLEYPEHE